MADLLGEMRTATTDPAVPERVRQILADALAEIIRLRAIAGPLNTDPDFATIRQDLKTG